MADKKITALTALGATDVAPAADLLHIIDYSASPVNKKITVANLFSNVDTDTHIYGATKTLEVGFAAATNAHLTVTTGADATTDGGVTINDDGVAYVDFTVKSLGSDGAFKVDAGTDDVTINSDSIAALDFTVNGDNGINLYSDGGLDCVGIGTGTVDGTVTATIAADGTTGHAASLAGNLLMTGSENVAPAATTVALSLTVPVTRLTIGASGESGTLTLADGTAGQIKHIVAVADGTGTVTLDATNRADAHAVTFQDIGDSWTGWYDSTLTKWITIGSNGYSHG